MLKNWTILLATIMTFGSSGAFAQDSQDDLASSDSIRIYSHTPCGGWRFDSTAIAHVCSFTDMQINVPDAYDVADVMQSMIARIEALEAEIDSLKSKK